MLVSKYTTKNLRKIALGLLKGTTYCDWHIPNDEDVSNTFQGLYCLSEVESLILQTKDIGMIFEKSACSCEMEGGNPVFSTFQTLTKEEALQVAEVFLRYKGFHEAYEEVIIPHR